MNIFVTNPSPAKSAQFLDDKRIGKMCLETAQLLCTAINQCGLTAPYKSTHVNHPCTKWVMESYSNWLWLWDHGMALGEEYYRRFNKYHKSHEVINELWHLYPEQFYVDSGLTPFANCAANKGLGINYKDEVDVHLAYQLYLNDRWDTDKRPPTWYGEKRI